MPVPSRRLKELIEGTVDHHASQRWPALEEVTISWRGSCGYLTGYLSEDDDDTIKLCRIQYLGETRRLGIRDLAGQQRQLRRRRPAERTADRPSQPGPRHRMHPLPRPNRRSPAITPRTPQGLLRGCTSRRSRGRGPAAEGHPGRTGAARHGPRTALPAGRSRPARPVPARVRRDQRPGPGRCHGPPRPVPRGPGSSPMPGSPRGPVRPATPTARASQ